MNEMELFENDELGLKVRTIQNPDGSISVNAEDTAIGFGWIQTQSKGRKEYVSVRWERMNAFSVDCGFPHEWGKDDYIPESLFYMLGFKAGNEKAQRYQRWIAMEVLPSIRKTGGYLLGEETMSEDELLSQALLVAQRKIEEKSKKIVLLETEVEIKNQIIGELKPKADYTSMILNNTGLVTITQIAKDYGKSGSEMNKILHAMGVQYKQSGQWLLYVHYQDKGYTHSKTVVITRKDGTPDTKLNTKWTQKGRLFLYELLKKNGYLPMIELQQTA